MLKLNVLIYYNISMEQHKIGQNNSIKNSEKMISITHSSLISVAKIIFTSNQYENLGSIFFFQNIFASNDFFKLGLFQIRLFSFYSFF